MSEGDGGHRWRKHEVTFNSEVEIIGTSVQNQSIVIQIIIVPEYVNEPVYLVSLQETYFSNAYAPEPRGAEKIVCVGSG